MNKDHLSSYFDHPEKQSAFYGQALFELWIFCQDTKYDRLFMRPDKSPFFLDGSHAFGGSEWEFDQMTYSAAKCFPQSPYLEGILTEPLFEEWFDRIESVPFTLVRSVLDAVPVSWEVSAEQLQFLFELLTSQRKQFLQLWKQKLINGAVG